MQLERYPITDLNLFGDGSCYSGEMGNLAGHAVVRYNTETDDFENMSLQSLSQPCSAQLAELKALTVACKLGEDKVCNIFTYSSYPFGVCQMYGVIWPQRGFVRTDGTKTAHAEAIGEFLEAMKLPKRLSIVKCAGHKRSSLITHANNATDAAAKQVAALNLELPLLAETIEKEFQDD